ncbi:MAG TPA: tyrosine-type recombinase/integrase [Chthonomonadaceae bacterium]|nr:tyrosine-type recombinase/integrase [Chthonomonadaceae bacterium]
MLMDSIEEYIRYIKYERGHAATTILNEQNRLRFLHKWLCENGYPAPGIDVLTTPMLRRYLHWLVERRLRPRTIKGKLVCIKSMCGYLVDNGLLTTNPVNALTLPKLDAAERKTITDAQIALLFEACEKLSSLRQVALSRAVFTVLAYAGLRRAEACDLLVNDVSVTENFILVRHGKGDKSRRIFIPEPAVDNLREWLALRPRCDHDFLFCRGNRRLHHDGLASIIEQLKTVAGLSGNEAIKPHSIIPPGIWTLE